MSQDIRMNMKQFLVNPTGKGGASLARRDRIRLDLEQRFFALNKKAKKMFSVESYIDKEGNYYQHIKVPSEEYYMNDLVYDVLIKFIPATGSSRVDPTLSRYNMQVFSNSPNFMFTYAYVFNQDGHVIPWTKPKLSQKAFNDAPVVRNPDHSYGFEKSLYFSILFIRENPKYLTKSMLNAKKLVQSDVLKKISSGAAKLKEHKAAKAKEESKNRIVKKMESYKSNRADTKSKSQNSTLKSNNFSSIMTPKKANSAFKKKITTKKTTKSAIKGRPKRTSFSQKTK